MTPEETKRRSRGFSQDMSGPAVASRIDRVSQLRELGLALKKAKILGPVSSSGAAAEGPSEVQPPGVGVSGP